MSSGIRKWFGERGGSKEWRRENSRHGWERGKGRGRCVWEWDINGIEEKKKRTTRWEVHGGIRFIKCRITPATSRAPCIGIFFLFGFPYFVFFFQLQNSVFRCPFTENFSIIDLWVNRIIVFTFSYLFKNV